MKAMFIVITASAAIAGALAQGTPPPAPQGLKTTPQSVSLAPGQQVPAELALSRGQAGQDLASLLGKQAVLLVYWRPKDAFSEQMLVRTAKAAPARVALFPVAVIATTQPDSDVGERLAALGLKNLAARQDKGELGLMLGVDKIPSLLLIDRKGILRVVGGSDLSQNGPDGKTIAEIAAIATAGGDTPTFGVLKLNRAYHLLDSALPGMSAAVLGTEEFHNLSDFTGKGKRTLVVYWSPQCPHCRLALPKLAEWYPRRPPDLQVVDVTRGDAPVMIEEAAKLIRQYPWTHLVDTQRFGGRVLMVSETPTALLVSPAGTITAIECGEGINWTHWLGEASSPPSSSPKK